MTLEELKELVNDKDTGHIVEMSAADLRMLAESNPEHPNSAVYLEAAAIRPDVYVLNVDREDVRGILENKEVVSERVWIKDSNGKKVPVIRKKLGKTIVKEESTEPVADET